MPFPIGRQLILLRHPPVSLANESDEERREIATTLDLLEADLDGGAVPGLLFSHSPSQIDFGKPHLSLMAGGTNARKDRLHQMGPLGVHVSERRGEEDSDFAGLREHAVDTWTERQGVRAGVATRGMSGV